MGFHPVAPACETGCGAPYLSKGRAKKGMTWSSADTTCRIDTLNIRILNLKL